MNEILELGTIVLGGIAATCAFAMSWYFAKSDRGIGKAVAVDKFAEGVNMIVILCFALAYYMDLFVKMPLAGAVALRTAAILATLGSSIHLAYQTKRVLDEKNEES